MESEPVTSPISVTTLSESDWRALCAEWAQGQEPQRVFCKQRDLNYSQFVVWRSRILQESGQSRLNAFVPVKCTSKPAEKPRRHGELNIHLPNGVILSVSSGVEPGLLQTTLKCLGAISC